MRRYGLDGSVNVFKSRLIDWTSRLHRTGKLHVPEEVASLFSRLGTSADIWSHSMERLHGRDREMGVVFAFDRARLREVAAHRQSSRVANINGCVHDLLPSILGFEYRWIWKVGSSKD